MESAIGVLNVQRCKINFYIIYYIYYIVDVSQWMPPDIQ